MQTPTTWIDLTDLSTWNGHFTGIQRVVYCYASRFAADGARFFVYDKIDDRHIEVQFSWLDRLKEQAANPPLSARQKIKHAIARPYYALPESQRGRLRPVIGILNHAIRTFLYKVVDGGRQRSPYRKLPGAEFTRGDTVIVIGAGWNEPGSLEMLSKLRTERQLWLVVHLNDILPIYQPHLFADSLPKLFNPYVDLAMRHANAITVISEATKRDVIIYCTEHKLEKPPIHIVRLGEDVKTPQPKKPAGFPLKDAFVLSVGTFEIRKNYFLLYQAAKLAQLEQREFPNIVIVGKKGWLTEDLAHVIQHDPFTHNKIIWLEGVSDAGLDWLYEHCMFTVFPSLFEGWGLPIVESLQHGKMCLTSNVSSMLEIGDGLVDYFSPYDSRSCMDKLVEYSKSGKYHALNRKVSAEYQAYSWDDSYAAFRGATHQTTSAHLRNN